MALPTLFGRATVVASEHAKLRQSVADLREMCARLAGRDVPSELQPLDSIISFYEHVQSHFLSEEEDGYFGTLAESSPALASQIAHLETEHRDMLAALQRLLKHQRERLDVPALVLGLNNVLATFDAHERQESRLMQDFFHLTGAEAHP